VYSLGLHCHRYGMLVSVLMGKEDDFKAFLSFYEHFRNSPNSRDLMSFQQAEDSDYGFMRSVGYNASSATDGDLDAAYALFLACALTALLCVQ
jgi:endo-1,4-beta-D-glucanase Y